MSSLRENIKISLVESLKKREDVATATLRLILAAIKDKDIILEKSGFDNEETKYLIKVYFENSPFIIRKIEVFINDAFLQISIFDHNYNEDFKTSVGDYIYQKMFSTVQSSDHRLQNLNPLFYRRNPIPLSLFLKIMC